MSILYDPHTSGSLQVFELAPRVFTKVLKPFVGYAIRNKGIKLVSYLDDMAIIISSREVSSQEAAINVVQILEKSILIRSQKMVFF